MAEKKYGELKHRELLELIRYDAETGQFTWKRPLGRKLKPGSPAGHSATNKYVSVRVQKVLYAAHRLAWFYVHGAWPDGEIDHIDGDPSNNRIANLRLADRKKNCANQRIKTSNTTGVKGVYYCKQQRKYRARICVNYRHIHLGNYDDLESASAAYDAAAIKYFGEFSRLNGVAK